MGNFSLFQAPRETREGEGEGTKTRGEWFSSPHPPLARLSRSLEEARGTYSGFHENFKFPCV